MLFYVIIMSYTDKMLNHLQSRYMNLDRHVVWIAKNEYCAVFPMWNLSGQLSSYQNYCPDKSKYHTNNSPKDSKYFTYRKAECWVPWGLESLYFDDGPVFVTEGIFDACRLTNHGATALATLTNNPPWDFRNFLSFLPRPVVAVLDNDPAGKKLAKCGDYVETVPQGDLGNSDESYVHYLLNKY